MVRRLPLYPGPQRYWSEELAMTIDFHLEAPSSSANFAHADADVLELPLTEEELTTLAMAADPDAPLSDDAIPLSLHLAKFAGAALPEWYMAPATSGTGRRWRTPVVLAVVFAFVLIEGLGLCNTFGQLTIA
jgi:hypothetical protein